jgi:hypothetical protein
MPESTRRGLRPDVEGTEWLFPIIESIHVLALTLVFGSIAMVDLRLIVAGGFSLAFWVAVVFFGRWIGFTT